MGFKTTFSYCVNAAAGNCMDAATGTGFVTVTDPDGNATVYGYTQGTQTSESAWTAGTTLASEQDYVPAQNGIWAKRGYAARHRDRRRPGQHHDERLQRGRERHIQHRHRTASARQAGTTTDSYTQPEPGSSCDGTDQAHRRTGCASASPPAPVAPGGVITAAVVGAAAGRDLDLVRHQTETSCTRRRASTSQAAAPPRTRDQLSALQGQQRHAERHHASPARRVPAVSLAAVRHDRGRTAPSPSSPTTPRAT